MATISLKISIPEKNAVKTMQLEPSLLVYEACAVIAQKIADVNQALGSPKEYGLFSIDEDSTKKTGRWLEPGRTLDYYMLRNGSTVEYKRKMRKLRIRMLDGTVKTVLVDESQPVANLMVVICTKIGITNHDEFSLVREHPDDGTYSHAGTLTLRKRHGTLDSKMEQLKKKLKTDDDLDWIDHAKTLREQGIEDDETLLLRRKFFFSDHNVDSRDPVQLNLLYVQAKSAIIAGSHPVTAEQACAFAGLQCQIQFNDYTASRHKPGFLELKDLLPKDFIKNKGIEKRVIAEHRKQIGLTELQAKVKYVQLARSLKTYGVTFFLVKEKMKGKNKLVPRLLGVTKDSVLRLDEKTKDILKIWPLTTVKRWAASLNSFTLDFGDYSDSYYSVQTAEGEQISQLIAGYIDIILKRKKAKDHFGIEGDEGSTIVEDSISPYKATILQHQTAPRAKTTPQVDLSSSSVAIPGELQTPEICNYSTGSVPFTQSSIKQQIHIGLTPKITPGQPIISSTLTEPQRALLSDINHAKETTKLAQRNLDDLPIGWTPSTPKKQVTFDLKKKSLNAQLSATSAATAQLINLTSLPEEQFDIPAIRGAIETVVTNIPDITRDVKVIATLMQDRDKGDKLIDAARKLCNAFSDLLNAAEPGKGIPRQSLLNAASRVGEATHALLASIKDPQEYDHETEDILLSLAKAVANATAALVLKAKDVAAHCDDQSTRNNVISAATQCALATQQLVSTAKVVSPTIDDTTCQRQISEASREVSRTVENIVTVTNESVSHPALIGDLKAASAAVARALNDLLNYVDSVSERKRQTSAPPQPPPPPPPQVESIDTVEKIYTATDRIFSSHDDPNEMIRQAKVLAKATVQLISDLKGQAATQVDSNQQKRLIIAARSLATATAKLVDAAKNCKSNPSERKYHEAIKEAVEQLKVATDTAQTTPVSPMMTRNRLYEEREIYESSSFDRNEYIHEKRDASPQPPPPPPPPVCSPPSPPPPPPPVVQSLVPHEPQYEDIRDIHSGVQLRSKGATFSAHVTKVEQMSTLSEIREERSTEKEVTLIRGSDAVLDSHNTSSSPNSNQLHQRALTDASNTYTSLTNTNGNDSLYNKSASSSSLYNDRHLMSHQQHLMQSSIHSDQSPYTSGGNNLNLYTNDNDYERNAYVLSELQSRAKGTQACTCAASTVSGIIGDLETTAMFATAGTLNPENETETFGDHRENIFKTAKALVEDTKTLVAGAASSQEQLAIAAQSAVMTMVNLAEVVKMGAASLGSANSEPQVLLLNAVKDVATALGELIQATKNAAGKSVNDPAMTYLKEAAKVMIVNATSLLKTVRTVEDEHQRGTLALESTIEAIGQEIRAYESTDIPNKRSTAEDLIRVTKPVTIATAKAVAAGSSGKQEDIIVVANMGRKAIYDVLITAKQCAYSTDSFDLRQRILESGKNCALYYRQLLQMVHSFVQRPLGITNEEKSMLSSISRTIATSVTEIVASAEALKGGDWIDPEDPTVIAETGLLGAASSIDAAAKKLASLQPRTTSVKVPDEDMNFDELILDAARSIASATAALVRAASAAQRELVATGRIAACPSYSSDDGQWSNGLISAARHVAAATHSLVEAANQLVQGQASEERLISAAKQVASSTAQLLVACKVKADSTSPGMKRLQEAGHAVKRATENLVKAAQQAIDHEEEQSIVLSRRRVSGIAQEIQFREAILKKERELDEARERLAAARRAKYKQQMQ